MRAYQKTILLLCSLAVASGHTLMAQEPSVLTLNQAVDEALARNLGLQIARLDPVIAEGELRAADADYDPELFAAASYSIRNAGTTYDQTVGSESDARTYQGGVRQKLSTGATVTLSTTLNRNDSTALTNIGSNLDYESNVGLEVRQPLLKGAWRDYNLAELRKAKSGLNESKLALRKQILDIVQETEQAYWDLAYAYAYVEMQRSGVKASEQLVAETESKFKANLASRVELLQAQSQLASDQEALLLAESNLESVADTLLVLIGGFQSTSVESIPVVSTLPQEFPSLSDYESVWINALQASEDVAIQEEQIYQYEQDAVSAWHTKRPQLDLVATGAYIGLDDTSVDNAYSNAADREGDQWGVMLEYSMPWGMNEGKARVQQARARVEQEEIRLIQVKQTLRSTTRSAWRNTNVGLNRVELTQTTLDLQEQAFAEAQAKYQRGLISFREMLEAQRDYDQARQNHLQSTLQLMKYEVDLSRIDGSLMARHGYEPLNNN